ncbi:hypothetical protein [Chryseobacterium camelliae]|uniref:hypothetical protein n=1 Tax=Chryseobacterium camelliae TaxID=1265445 RepID=UPI00285AF67E|nr:hypothetical protein [Chryseobacterium camelliae]MDR6515369.1 hypothetical protein [Chryseobacterium camelliae]
MIKRALGLFWVIIILYFIFVHPAIIYYSTVHYSDLANRSSSTAIFYLILSITLWTGIFLLALYMIYKYSFQAQRNIGYISKHGKKISAEIIESKTLGSISSKFERRSVIMEFDNLRGTTVWHTMEINDSKPAQKRFETGNTIYLWVDETFRKLPYIVLDGIQTRINYRLYVAWLMFAVLVTGYFLYAYSLENHRYGWRFMEIGHPLIVSPFVIYGIILLIWLIFFKLLGKGGGFIAGKDLLRLKFAGLKTMAKIVKTEQTGTYINENPQFRFTLEYADSSGKIHQVTLTRIVPLIKLQTIQQKEREIFYLQEDPENIAFAEDINSIA